MHGHNLIWRCTKTRYVEKIPFQQSPYFKQIQKLALFQKGQLLFIHEIYIILHGVIIKQEYLYLKGCIGFVRI